MRLTQLTDIGLRVLMYLTVFEDQICTVDQMVRDCLARKQLTIKAVQKLKKAGYIRSRRGRAGGFELARPPEAISAAEIILLMEPDIALAECFRLGAQAKCTIVGKCLLQAELQAALKQMMSHIEAVSVRDLTNNEEEIIEMNKNFKRMKQENWIY